MLSIYFDSYTFPMQEIYYKRERYEYVRVNMSTKRMSEKESTNKDEFLLVLMDGET